MAKSSIGGLCVSAGVFAFERGGAWHSKNSQKLNWFAVFHVSIWGAWSFVWGAKTQGCGVGSLTTLGVAFFCPTLIPDVQLDHFLHHSPKLGIPVEMVPISFEIFVETGIFCCEPRFPLISTAKFRSLYVKESEILERSESDILPPTPQPC